MPTPDFVLALRRHIGQDLLFLTGVTAVVLREPNGPGGGIEVLLVRRSDNGRWTPVTGIVDPGEQVHLAAQREVLEETGVDAIVQRLVWVATEPATTHVNGDRAQYVDHTFRCVWRSGEPIVGDDESTEVRFFPVSALPPISARHRARIECVLENPPDVRLGP